MDTVQEMRRRLTEGRVAEIYRATCRSIEERLGADGFFPESVAGGYGHAEFCRTVGALEAFFTETEEYEKAQRAVGFALASARRSGVLRIPHVAFPVGEDGSQQFSLDDEVDGTLHVLGAFARLGRDRRLTPEFEEEWMPFVRQLLRIICDMPYFYYNGQQPIDVYPQMFPPESMKLLFNCAFEHSREGRRWSCFDLLTQCFFGGTLEAMAALCDRRGETADAAFYRETMALLREGVAKYLTRETSEGTVYLEMRLPDGGFGRPFLGMGWPLLSPVAARWQPLTQEVLDRTVALMRKRLWRRAPHTDGAWYLCTEDDEDGSVNPAILGKLQGWDMVYSLSCGEYAHLLDWLDFIETVNTPPLLAENLTPHTEGWQYNDPGNGEQSTWWCWAIAHIRRSLGLPALDI